MKDLKNYWFVLSLIVILGLGIVLFYNICEIKEERYVGFILGFVGVLTTFIVIGNYAQVIEIRNEFKEKVEDLRTEFNNSIDKLKDENFQLEINKIYTEVQNSKTASIYYREKQQFQLAFDAEINSINNLIKIKDIELANKEIDYIFELLKLKTNKTKIANSTKNVWKYVISNLTHEKATLLLDEIEKIPLTDIASMRY
jgi:uncharacterized membrane protein YgaE (UPF0421/DUF939 family)